MGLNCSLRKVISVENYLEASATKWNYAFSRLEYTLKAVGNHLSCEMQGFKHLETEHWCRSYLKTVCRFLVWSEFMESKVVWKVSCLYTERPRQGKPKEEHTKTHSNQLTKIKGKDKILKTTREKWQITSKRTPIRLSADFSTETLQARREGHDIFKVMKGKNLPPRILYPAQLLLGFDGESKSFPETQKLRELSTTKPALQQMLKELL